MSDRRNVFEHSETTPAQDDRIKIFVPVLDVEVQASPSGVVLTGHFPDGVLSALEHLIIPNPITEVDHTPWPPYDH